MSWAPRFTDEVLFSSRADLGSVLLVSNTPLPLDLAGATKTPIPPNMGSKYHGVRCRIEFTVSTPQSGQFLGGYSYISDADGATQLAPYDFYVGPADHAGQGFMDFAFTARDFEFSEFLADVYREPSTFATANSSGDMTYGGSSPVPLSRPMLDAGTITATMFSSFGYTVTVDAVYVSWFPTADTPVQAPTIPVVKTWIR